MIFHYESGPYCVDRGPVVELAYTSDLKSDAYFGLASSSLAGATKEDLCFIR